MLERSNRNNTSREILQGLAQALGVSVGSLVDVAFQEQGTPTGESAEAEVEEIARLVQDLGPQERGLLLRLA